MMTATMNRLTRTLAPIEYLPGFVRTGVRSFVIGNFIRFVGTAQIKVEKLSHDEGIFTLRNRRKVQNHIRGVHAAATALLAETASGLVVGMHVPDDKLPLLKSMKVDYVRRATGGLRATARLVPEQIQEIHTTDRGSVAVDVVVTDDAGNEPVRCEMIWAWVPKKQRPS